MKMYQYFIGIFLSLLLLSTLMAQEEAQAKKEQVLDFSAGIIEGELNPPSILMELGTNFKDFDDLVLLRENFNKYHKLDSVVRFRYTEENL